MRKENVSKLLESMSVLAQVLNEEMYDISFYNQKVDLSAYPNPILFGGGKKKEKKNEK